MSKAIYNAQTQIMKWLRSQGHSTVEGDGTATAGDVSFEMRSCKSKRNYPTHAEAMSSAAKMRMKVYACRFCGGYHLTSQGLL
jgi:hypothetical protein